MTSSFGHKAWWGVLSVVVAGHVVVVGTNSAKRVWWMIGRNRHCSSSSAEWRRLNTEHFDLILKVQEAVPPHGQLLIPVSARRSVYEIAYYAFPRRVKFTNRDSVLASSDRPQPNRIASDCWFLQVDE
jgi:hypothetical protein